MILRMKNTTVKAVVAKISRHPYLHIPSCPHPDALIVRDSEDEKRMKDLSKLLTEQFPDLETDQEIIVGDSPTGTIQGDIEGAFFIPEVWDAGDLEEEQCTWDFESHVESYFAWRTRGGYLLSLYESDDEEAPYDVFLYIEHEDKEAHESTMFVPNVLSAIFKDI